MKKIGFLLIISSILIASCKDSDRDTDTSTNSCTDYAMAQSYALDAFKIVHQAALSSKGITNNNLSDTTTIFGCDTLIVDTTTNPMSITVQFNGVCGNSGNTRSGSITANFSNKYDALGTNVSISFNNYTYNDYPISGTIGYGFNGIINTIPTYTIAFNSLTFKNSKERYLTFAGNQTIGITSGETTAKFTDDNYSISGTASGRAFAGNEFNSSITSNLSLSGNCNWISSGVSTISPTNKVPRTLDFGSGCDNKASAEIYDISYEIVIP